MERDALDLEERRPPRYLAPVVVVVVTLFLLALFLPAFVNANRWRVRLTTSLSSAMGRPVSVGGLHLQLLPLPAFTLDNFSVADTSPGGVEPVLRSGTVTARLRLLPLLLGRLEVAHISLDSASLNLRRSTDGTWNFESLLAAPAQLPATPTGARASRGRFPYIDVTGGRVNIQRGVEKLPECLMDADIAIWLESPTEWRFRMRALPARTDIPNSGLGEVRLDGNIQRAKTSGGDWRDSGLHITGSWRGLQMGQLSRVLTRQDAGWRGDANISLNVTGTLSDMHPVLGLELRGLRRAEYVPTDALDLSATCRFTLAAFQHAMDHGTCLLPAGGGAVLLEGSGSWGSPETRALHAKLSAAAVPAQWLLSAVRAVHQGIQPELSADGAWSAKLAFDSPALPGAAQRLTGFADWKDGVLSAPSLKMPITLPAIHFDADATQTAAPVATRARGKRKAAKSPPPESAPHMTFSTATLTVPMGAKQPLTVQAGVSPRGYALHLSGAADAGEFVSLLKLLGMAHLHGVRSATGTLNAQLDMSGTWTGPASGVAANGTLSLDDATLETEWIPGSVSVQHADAVFAPGTIRLAHMRTRWAATDWDVSALFAADCETAPCPWQLTVHTPLLDASHIRDVFHEDTSQRFLDWLRGEHQAGWPPAQVALEADTLLLGNVPMAHASGAVSVHGTSLHLTRFSSAMLGGQVEATGTWEPAQSTADIHIGASGINLETAGAPFDERWGKGALEAKAALHFAGSLSPEGEFSATTRNAALLGTDVEGTPLALFDTWQMSGTVHDNALVLDRSGLLEKPQGAPVSVTGKIGFDRTFDLQTASDGNANAPAKTYAGKIGAAAHKGDTDGARKPQR